MKVSLKKAIKGFNHFDLSSTHLTTMDFGCIQPTYIQEVVPNDSFKVNMSSFARLAPLAVPVFGRIECTSRAFFVPMRSIWHGFEEWISGSNDASLSSNILTVYTDDICKWLTDTNFSYPVTEDDKYDFSLQDLTGAPVTKYYRFTSRGRWFYKVLLSLGYSVNFTTDEHYLVSALPLLAFLRVFYDFIYPSQYVQQLSLGGLFEKRVSINQADIKQAFIDVLSAPYAQDYFTSAWRDSNQVGSSDNVDLAVSAEDGVFSQAGNYVRSNVSDIRMNGNTASSGSQFGHITAFGMRVLSAVNDFITRNNIAGSRYFEQLLARFGVSSPKATPNRSVFLRSVSDPIQIQDVTATATTEGSVLGEQGAKGIQSSPDNGHEFSFTSEDTFGYLIVLSHVMPNTGYYQGRKRHTLHVKRFDFYTPEFDSIGLQPIRSDEVFADFKSPSAYTAGLQYGGEGNGVFGFAPRYAEYKKRDDYLTGDFRVPSASTGLDSYHMMRILPNPSSTHPLALSPSFLQVRQHEFDRIFQQVGQNVTGYGFTQVDTRSVFTYQGKIIVFTDADTHIYGVIHVNKSHSSSLEYSQWYLTTYTTLAQIEERWNLPTVFAVTIPSMTQILTHFGGTGTGIDSIVFQIPGFVTDFVLSNDLDNTAVAESVVSVGGRNISPTEFESLFLEYFDHFYTVFRFNVDASRTMLSISDSMPIEDGGDKVSVDYEGFNFGM